MKFGLLADEFLFQVPGIGYVSYMFLIILARVLMLFLRIGRMMISKSSTKRLLINIVKQVRNLILPRFVKMLKEPCILGLGSPNISG